jgi:hypothetical protein
MFTVDLGRLLSEEGCLRGRDASMLPSCFVDVGGCYDSNVSSETHIDI